MDYQSQGVAQAKYTGNSLTTAAQLNALPKAEPQLDMLEQRIRNTAAQIGSLVVRSRDIADRVLGTAPQPVSGDVKATDRPPTMRRLQFAVDELQSMADMLGNQIERLESL